MPQPPPPLPPDPENEWGSSETSESDAGRAASVAVWVAAGLDLALSSCCISVAVLIAAFLDQVLQQQPLPPGFTEQQVRLSAIITAGLMGVVIFLPGLALAVLGFAVRRGARTGTLIALGVAVVQTVLVGLLLVLIVVSVAANLVLNGSLVNPLEMLVYLAIFGGLLAVLVWAIRSLLRARHAASDENPFSDEPWNSHLPRGL